VARDAVEATHTDGSNTVRHNEYERDVRIIHIRLAQSPIAALLTLMVGPVPATPA